MLVSYYVYIQLSILWFKGSVPVFCSVAGRMMLTMHRGGGLSRSWHACVQGVKFEWWRSTSMPPLPMAILRRSKKCSRASAFGLRLLVFPFFFSGVMVIQFQYPPCFLTHSKCMVFSATLELKSWDRFTISQRVSLLPGSLAAYAAASFRLETPEKSCANQPNIRRPK